jgi:hypothetical protein
VNETAKRVGCCFSGDPKAEKENAKQEHHESFLKLFVNEVRVASDSRDVEIASASHYDLIPEVGAESTCPHGIRNVPEWLTGCAYGEWQVSAGERDSSDSITARLKSRGRYEAKFQHSEASDYLASALLNA